MDSKIDSFANRLSIAMKENNINQVELSEKTKKYTKSISQSLINKYLKGKALARQDNIYKLCEILGVDEAWIMGYDVPMKRTPNSLRKINSDYKYASYEGIDTDGLDEEDIEELNRFADYIRSKKKKNKED